MLTALATGRSLAAVAPVVAGQSNTTILIAIMSGLGAALVTLGGQLLFRKQTKDKLIAETSDELIGGAKALLEDYRLELAAAKRELAELRERVTILEEQLRTAKEARQQLAVERQHAIEELARVQQRVDDLEKVLKALEQPHPPPHHSP